MPVDEKTIIEKIEELKKLIIDLDERITQIEGVLG